jgi:F0F1-type ATP synthase assembly protein I
MKQTDTPPSTSVNEKQPTPAKTKASKNRSNKYEFIVAASNMSWQLAIVVLVPVIGGYKLDVKLNSSPVITIIGLIIAMIGSGLVLRNQLKKFGPAPIEEVKKKPTKKEVKHYA